MPCKTDSLFNVTKKNLEALISALHKPSGQRLMSLFLYDIVSIVIAIEGDIYIYGGFQCEIFND